MKKFFEDLISETQRLGDFVRSVYPGSSLQNELVNELNIRIMAHKLQVVGEKIQAYYEATTQPDIPDFMKPKNQQIKEKVKCDLFRLLLERKLDYFYHKALEDESKGD